MQGDIIRNMYPIPAVYRRIFNQLIQILHWLLDNEIFSDENRVILLRTVEKWRCVKLCAIFSGPLCNRVNDWCLDARIIAFDDDDGDNVFVSGDGLQGAQSWHATVFSLHLQVCHVCVCVWSVTLSSAKWCHV